MVHPGEAAGRGKDRDSKRAEIIRRLWDAVPAGKLAGASMDDYAAELGMSKRTVYEAFEDKGDIILAVLLAHMHQVAEGADRVLRRDLPYESTVYLTLTELLQLPARLDPRFVADVARRHGARWSEFQKQRDQVLGGILLRLIRAGRTAGRLRPEISDEIVHAVLGPVMESVVRPETVERTGLTVRRVVEGVLVLVLGGLLARPEDTDALLRAVHGPDAAD